MTAPRIVRGPAHGRRTPVRAALLGVVAAIVLLAVGRGAQGQGTPADLLVIHANILTMEPATPRAEWMAVEGGVIRALGTTASFESWRGARTRVLDLSGASVLPGFIDAHLHMLEYGEYLLKPSLTGKSLPEVERMVKEVAGARQGFVRFQGWGAYLPSADRFPTNELLNRWAPDRAVVLEKGDGHVALFNDAALRAVDIDALMESRKLSPSLVERDGSGRPTGMLLEDALWAAMEVIEHHETNEARRTAVQATLAKLNEVGVTTAQNILFWPELAPVYRALSEEGALTVRVNLAMLGRVERAQKERVMAVVRGADTHYLRVNAAKYFADGAMGAGTAALLEPYSNRPDSRGLLQWKGGSEMLPFLEDDLALGLQPMVHAMGDRAVQTALDAFEVLVARHGPADYRFRIEHGNMVEPRDRARWARLGVVWSHQPTRWSEGAAAARVLAIGEQRAANTENVPAFLADGIPVAIGSDAPFYVDINPLVNVANLATRPWSRSGTATPTRIPVDKALEMITRGGAIAARDEATRGTLGPGKFADFVVLSANPLAVSPDAVRSIRVVHTFLGGVPVWPPAAAQ